MEVKEQPILSFLGVDIINVNFSAFAPRSGELKINIKCDPKVFYPSDDKHTFKILMDVSLQNVDYFELSLKAVGSFFIDSEIEENIKTTLVNTNAPAIMFPYIRSFVATFTANIGDITGRLLIPTQFFSGKLEEIENFE